MRLRARGFLVGTTTTLVLVAGLVGPARASTPTVPPSYQPYTSVAVFGAYGNSNAGLGDCQSAAAADLVQLWEAEAGNWSGLLPQAPVTAMYRHIEPLTVFSNSWFPAEFKWWSAHPQGSVQVTSWHGLQGSGQYGDFRSSQIGQIKRLVALDGGAIGVAQVPSIDGNYAPGQPWTLANSPGGTFGHAFAIVGYSPGYLYTVMWGRLTPVTWQWWDQYGQRVYVVGHR